MTTSRRKLAETPILVKDLRTGSEYETAGSIQAHALVNSLNDKFESEISLPSLRAGLSVSRKPSIVAGRFIFVCKGEAFPVISYKELAFAQSPSKARFSIRDSVSGMELHSFKDEKELKRVLRKFDLVEENCISLLRRETFQFPFSRVQLKFVNDARDWMQLPFEDPDLAALTSVQITPKKGLLTLW